MEWNALVKPIVYVVELIFAAVVTFGTADQLLVVLPTDNGGKSSHCALSDSLAACGSVITIGSICFLGALAVLWWRLQATFAADAFSSIDEAVACCILSVGWLVNASVITHNFPISLQDSLASQKADVVVMRNTITAFSWLNTVLYFCSAALSLFAPERDPPQYDPYYEPETSKTRSSNVAPAARETTKNSSSPPEDQTDSTRSIGASTDGEVPVPSIVSQSLAARPPHEGSPTMRGLDIGTAVAPGHVDRPGCQDRKPDAIRRRRNGPGQHPSSIIAAFVPERHSAPAVVE